MELNYYQKEAHKTSLHNTPVIYPALGLAGEAGEVADKIKKLIRDKDYKPGDEININDKEAIMLELGDVLWYVAEFAHDLGITLEEIGRQNLQKLKSRQERNMIHGSGDER